MRAEPRSVLRIEDRTGRVLRDFPERSENVLDAEVARAINDMLSDNVARTPAFGANSFLHFPGRAVAAKTGTTNDYRDAWIMGYTPEIAVGAWAGNNDNRSMEKRVAGFIIAPLWHEFMTEAFKQLGQTQSFTKPQPLPHDLKPVLRGVWQYPTGPARAPTPSNPDTDEEDDDDTEERAPQPVGSFAIHSILHWVNRNDPRGPAPSNPSSDQQYALWEYGVAAWRAGAQHSAPSGGGPIDPEERPQIRIQRPEGGERFAANETIRVRVETQERNVPLSRIEYYINGTLVEQTPASNRNVSISLDGVAGLTEENSLRAIIYDENGTLGFDSVSFSIR
jgi:membrane peptidoglycan carboxypeptidase